MRSRQLHVALAAVAALAVIAGVARAQGTVDKGDAQPPAGTPGPKGGPPGGKPAGEPGGGVKDWRHRIDAQVVGANRNDNWAQLQATCKVAVTVEDTGGSIDGKQPKSDAVFTFNLDPTGSGQSGWQTIATDKECHIQHIHKVTPLHVNCDMAGGAQKADQSRHVAAEDLTPNGDPSAPTGAAKKGFDAINKANPAPRPPTGPRPTWTGRGQSFSERYFTLTLITSERACIPEEPPMTGDEPTVPVFRRSMTPVPTPAKKPGFLESLLGHLSVGVGVGVGGDSRHESKPDSDRPRSSPTPPPSSRD